MAADLKSLLKACKAAFAENDYAAALNHCKAAMAIDPKNYYVLVFTATAALRLDKDPENVAATFRRAVGIDGAALPAWQGLAELYTKTGNNDELVTVYKELVTRCIDAKDLSKARDYRIKGAELLQKSAKLTEAIAEYKNILSDPVLGAGTIEQASVIQAAIVGVAEEIFEADKAAEVKKRCKKLLKTLTAEAEARDAAKAAAKAEPKASTSKAAAKAVAAATPVAVTVTPEMEAKVAAEVHAEWLLKCSALDDETRLLISLPIPAPEAIYVKFIERMLGRLPTRAADDRENLRREIIGQCQHMASVVPHSLFPLRTALLVNDEEVAFLSAQDHARLSWRLVHQMPSDGRAQIAWGLELHNRGRSDEALTLLERGGAAMFDLAGTRAQVAIHMAKNNHQSVIALTEKALAVLTKREQEGAVYHTARLELLETRATAFVRSRRFAEGLGVCDLLQQLVPDHHLATTLRGTAYFESGDYAQAEQIFLKLLEAVPDSSAALTQLAWISHLAGNHTAAVERLTKALEKDPTNADTNLKLGMVYWAMGGTYRSDKELAQKSFLKAAKFNPNAAAAYAYLGHFYRLVDRDLEKARRCYQKALALDAAHGEAGPALSDLYLDAGQTTLAMSLWQDVVGHAPRAAWAWVRLACAYVNARNDTAATNAFQNALRADTKLVAAWNGLGDVYIRQGKFVASLKAFTRSVELDPRSVYGFYRVGCVKQAIGMLNEALNAFQTCLAIEPRYLPAMKGLGETHLIQATDAFSRGLSGLGLAALAEADTILSQCSEAASHIVCVWKLLGDVRALAAKHGQSQTRARATAYAHALHLDPASAAAWYDLGTEQAAAGNVATAAGIFQASLAIDPTFALARSALGVVHRERNPELAQHAFITTAMLNPTNALAWSNLGLMYAEAGAGSLAERVFTAAQAVDPTATTPWVARGILGGSYEAFAQARALGALAGPGSLGLAFAANAVDKHALALNAVLPLAHDSPPNASALHLLGVLLLRRGQISAAIATLERAKELAAPEQHNDVNLALGWAYLQGGNHARATTAFKDCPGAERGKAFAAAAGGDARNAQALWTKAGQGADKNESSRARVELALSLASTDGAAAIKVLEGLQTEEAQITLLALRATQGDQITHPSLTAAPSLSRMILHILIAAQQGDDKAALRRAQAAIHAFPLAQEAIDHLVACLVRNQRAGLARDWSTVDSPAREGVSHQRHTDLKSLFADAAVQLQLAQRAVHAHPGAASSWLGLAQAVHARAAEATGGVRAAQLATASAVANAVSFTVDANSARAKSRNAALVEAHGVLSAACGDQSTGGLRTPDEIYAAVAANGTTVEKRQVLEGLARKSNVWNMLGSVLENDGRAGAATLCYEQAGRSNQTAPQLRLASLQLANGDKAGAAASVKKATRYSKQKWPLYDGPLAQ